MEWGISPLTMPPKAIINLHSAGGENSERALAPQPTAISLLTGALTADTYKEILAVSGAGVITICAACTKDTTSRTLGLKIVIDGVTVFDAVTNAITTVYHGIIAIGGGDTEATSIYLEPEPIPFYESLSVSVKSSVEETDKSYLIYAYRTV